MKSVLLSNLLFLLVLLSFNVHADIKIEGKEAQNIWRSVEIISTIEDVSIIKINDEEKYFFMDSVHCVFEMYNGCSFFTNINGKRKMIVALEGTAKLMQSLADVGVEIDTTHARIATKSILCSKKNLLLSTITETMCVIIEYDN